MAQHKLSRSWWKRHTQLRPGGSLAENYWQMRLGYRRHNLPLWHSKSVKSDGFRGLIGYEV